MNTRFYDSVEIPEDILKAYDRIFYLRNLFQDAELYTEELNHIEQELVATLPVLDKQEEAIETYAAEDLDMGRLREMFKDDIRPIVIKGYAKEHEAVKKWTPEFFKEKYGNLNIFFTSSEKLVNDTGITLSEFVDQVLAGNPNRNYIENMTDIFNYFPELHDQVGIEKIKNYLGDYASYHKIAQFFLGGRSTGAVYHCANELNCFFNIYGLKKWTFVHPKYAIAMATTLMNKGFFVGSFIKHRSPKGFIENNTPLYNRIPKLSIVLEPGDVLFNPPWWWHAIDNQTQATIAVATRWRIEEKYIRQNICYDLVESMRTDRLGNRVSEVEDGEVVISDSKLRKNYVTYDEMGWKGK